MAHLNHSSEEDSVQQNYKHGKTQSSLECGNNVNSCHGNEESLESFSETAMRHLHEEVEICMVDEASTLDEEELLNQDQQRLSSRIIVLFWLTGFFGYFL